MWTENLAFAATQRSAQLDGLVCPFPQADLANGLADFKEQPAKMSLTDGN